MKEKLYFNEKANTLPKITMKNRVIEDICQVEDEVVKNEKLVDNMFKLKSINLLKPRESRMT